MAKKIYLIGTEADCFHCGPVGGNQYRLEGSAFLCKEDAEKEKVHLNEEINRKWEEKGYTNHSDYWSVIEVDLKDDAYTAQEMREAVAVTLQGGMVNV